MIEMICLISFLMLIGMVLVRSIMMKRLKIQVIKFAKTNKSDWCLPPIVFFVIYHLIASVFDLPRVSGPNVLNLSWLKYIGILSCLCADSLFLWGLISFETSFRVGIDDENPGKLVTTGAFGVTRNPLYMAFGLELIGIFCIFPNILFLFVLIGGFWLFNRQIKREEKFMKEYYGKEFEEYCQHVRRYI